MLNMLSRTMTELPLQTVSISSYGEKEQASKKIRGKKYQITSITDKGYDKQENEDGVLVKSGDTALGHSLLLAVADGVGGLECGSLASRIAIDGLKEWWNITLKAILYRDVEHIEYLINESLSAAIDKINTEVYEQGNKSGKRMASTLSVAFVLNDWYCIKHIGDSRIYLLSHGFKQLTEDHNLLNQYLKSGSMEDIKCNYKALNNVLTKCLGIKPDIELFEQTGKITDSEGILLCTDGLYKLLSVIEISRNITSCCHSTEVMQQTLQLLINKARKRGERDDISAIVMVIEKKSQDKWLRLKRLMNGGQCI